MNVQLRNILHPQNARNKMLRNNILLSGIIKIAGLCTSFLVVPITLNYLASEQYGIWMTLSSILFWFSFFDVGLGNGMRNYLAVSIAEKDFAKGRTYIATTLTMLSSIALLLAIAITCLAFYLDWNSVFNTNTLNNDQLREVVLIACLFTLIVFVVKNIGMVYVALQKYAINDLLIVLGNIISLLLIFLCTKIEPEGNLSLVVLIFTLIPVLVFIIGGIPLFIMHPELRPTLHNFDWSLAKQLINKGIGFFFIQITSCLVIFGGSNIFIIQYVGPEAVTTYNISYKYFNLLAIAYTVIISPMWNAYTDAYVKKDFAWIKNTFRHALLIWGCTVIGGIVMLLFSQVFFQFWIGNTVVVPLSVSISVLTFITFFNLNNCVTALINGLNKIQVQIITSVIITILYIAVVLCFGEQLNIEGIAYCMAGSYIIMSLIHLYQCHLLINQHAVGIWDK